MRQLQCLAVLLLTASYVAGLPHFTRRQATSDVDLPSPTSESAIPQPTPEPGVPTSNPGDDDDDDGEGGDPDPQVSTSYIVIVTESTSTLPVKTPTSLASVPAVGDKTSTLKEISRPSTPASPVGRSTSRSELPLVSGTPTQRQSVAAAYSPTSASSTVREVAATVAQPASVGASFSSESSVPSCTHIALKLCRLAPLPNTSLAPNATQTSSESYITPSIDPQTRH